MYNLVDEREEKIGGMELWQKRIQHPHLKSLKSSELEKIKKALAKVTIKPLNFHSQKKGSCLFVKTLQKSMINQFFSKLNLETH